MGRREQEQDWLLTEERVAFTLLTKRCEIKFGAFAEKLCEGVQLRNILTPDSHFCQLEGRLFELRRQTQECNLSTTEHRLHEKGGREAVNKMRQQRRVARFSALMCQRTKR